MFSKSNFVKIPIIKLFYYQYFFIIYLKNRDI